MSALAAYAEEAPEAGPTDDFAVSGDIGVFEFPDMFGSQEFNALLRWASDRKASDITFESARPVMADVAGEIRPVSHRPIMDEEIDSVIRYVYGEHATGYLKAGYDIDCSHEVQMRNDLDPLRPVLKRYRLNMTMGRAPGGDAKQMTVRTLPATPVPLDRLGLETPLLDNMRPSSGMFLMTGPTGSGKSTTLSSIVAHRLGVEDANEKILEYSSPIEYVYDDVRKPSSMIFQTEVGRHLRPHDGGHKASEESLFAYAVRNALRRKPTAILLGEIRDTATMKAGLEAALTGHLLWSTMHTTGVPATLRRIVQFFPDGMRDGASADILETIRVVCTQLLFPRRGGGRVALREFMVFDETTRRQFAKRRPEEWPAFARNLMIEGRAQSQTMATAAWKALDAGLIDKATYKRVAMSESNGA